MLKPFVKGYHKKVHTQLKLPLNCCVLKAYVREMIN